MAIPTAVSPSILTPGLYLTVDLLAGSASPGTGTLKVALLASKSSAGDLTNNTEVRAGSGEASASTAFGPGTAGHLAAKLIYAKYPAAQIDFVSPAPGSGTATLNVTATGSPTSDNAVRFVVMGRSFDVPWLASESADAFKTRAISYFAQQVNNIAVAASSGGVGVITVDSKVAGYIGNDIKVKANLVNAQTGTEAIDTNTLTALSGGASDPDLTTALASIAGKEYAVILPCLSNTDVANVGAANNLSKVVSHIGTYNTGLAAKLQQVVAGYTGSIASAAATTVHANSLGNTEVGELVDCVNGQSLPCEFAAREVGGWLSYYSVDPAANRIGEVYDGVYGSEDVIADRPTLSESETALAAGVSLVSYNESDQPYIVRPITTHSQDSAGGADRRLLDVQNVVGAYAVVRDVRSALPQEFPQAKIAEDTEPGEDPPPPGVVEVRDVKSFIISRLRAWQNLGVVTKASLDAAIDGGTLIVQINSVDPTQVDIVMPFSIFQPLAKFGLVAQRVPN